MTCEVGVEMPIWNVPGLAFSCSTSSLIEFDGDIDVAHERGGDQRKERDRDEILERIVGELAVEERVHHQRSVDRHEQRVAVGSSLGDRLRTDDGVGTRPVVDDDLLAQILAHFLANEPSEKVGGPAGSKRHDQRDLARGIGLRRCPHRREEETRRSEGEIPECIAHRAFAHPAGTCFRPTGFITYGGYCTKSIEARTQRSPEHPKAQKRGAKKTKVEASRAALVTAGYRAQRCAYPRQRRFYPRGPKAHRIVVAAFRAAEPPAQGGSVSIRALDAQLLYQSCGEEFAGAAQANLDACQR